MPVKTLTANADYVDLTEADIASIQFQVVGDNVVQFIRSASQPASTENGWEYRASEGDLGALSDIFPYSSGSRLWVRATTSARIRYEFS